MGGALPKVKARKFDDVDSIHVCLQVVFRSASSHFFIFIQISSEMWDFDSSGKNEAAFS